MEKILEQVRAFADHAHGDQKRKYTPERYIVHPVRVMELCRQYNNALPVLAAALLHDVLEDTRVTKKELHQFLLTIMSEADADETVKLVVELSDVYTRTAYPRWNRSKRKQKESARIEQTSGSSQTIKYADIIDNCSEIVTADPEFAEVFLLECRMLLKQMKKGDDALYRRAVETVDNCLRRL
jgi:(p)ppGpp synthase/HD superfamily hydrolase